jgi:DNA-binding transcriptional regulator PaaX
MPKFLLGRRQFTLGAAAAATAALIHPSEALAQTTGNLAELDQKIRTAMAKLTPQGRAEVEAKVANIFRRYGDRLSDEQKADIRRVMAETQEGLDKMRAFPLENGDQPADTFRAYRHEAQPSAEKTGEEKK